MISSRARDGYSCTSTQEQTFFTIIPAEIRNQIFSLCISQALVDPRLPQLRSWPFPLLRENEPAIVVQSPRKRQGYLKLRGIGPLPLLAVNKQAYAEVYSLIYALVDAVTIGHSVPQYLDEDTNEWWNSGFALLKQIPDITKRAKNLRVFLPLPIATTIRTTYASLQKEVEGKDNAMSIPPGLDMQLENFESLETLTLVWVGIRQEPPHFEELLPLWGRYGSRLTVQFEYGRNQIPLGRTPFNFYWRDKLISFMEARGKMVKVVSNTVCPV